jgi:hypothetical protein
VPHGNASTICLCEPLGGRVTGHREPEQLSSTVAQHIRAMNNVRQKDLTAIDPEGKAA